MCVCSCVIHVMFLTWSCLTGQWPELTDQACLVLQQRMETGDFTAQPLVRLLHAPLPADPHNKTLCFKCSSFSCLFWKMGLVVLEEFWICKHTIATFCESELLFPPLWKLSWAALSGIDLLHNVGVFHAPVGFHIKCTFPSMHDLKLPNTGKPCDS